MNTLLLYMIKSAFYLAGFYFVYSLFLRNDTLYSRNRLYILFSIAASFILPLITLKTSRPLNLFFGRTFDEVFVTPAYSGAWNRPSSTVNADVWDILTLIYIAGLVLISVKLLIDFLEIIFLILSNRKRNSNIIRFKGLDTSGFSAMGWIFINSALDEPVSGEIKKHEQNHLDHYHFIDIMAVETVKALQWFNPFIYLFNRSLREVHEFQADEGCLKTGIPLISYQRLIMSQVFNSKVFSITNSFSNPTLIKKRMIMMTKERSRMPANLKLLMVLPVIAVVMLAFSSCKGKATGTDETTKEIAPPPPPPPPPVDSSAEEKKSEPLTEVDEMPVFPGGDAALLRHIFENTKYPEKAKTGGIQGRVVVRFAVETDGTIDKLSVLKGVDPELDAEALRVIGTLPKFDKPGIKDGKPVPVWYMVPITFALQ